MPAPLQARHGDRVRVAIAGGGFAAAEAAIALRHLAGERVAIDMVATDEQLTMRPLAVAAPFGMEESRGVPLADLCADLGVTLHQGTVTLVDAPGHRLETDRGTAIPFDAAVVATGARRRRAVEGALLFDGRRGIVELRRLIGAARERPVGTIVFAVPAGVTWALPAYELALMTALRTGDRSQVTVVTPEQAPLELFGPAASRRLAALLDEQGIDLVTDSEPLRVVPAGLQTTRGVVVAHNVVALPRVEGPRVPGLPSDGDGFLPVDAQQLVDGTANVYAAGDVVAFPVKQGGLAAQQADVAAGAIAARAGAPVVPEPFRPVLRAMLLTGSLPLFVRGPGGEMAADASEAPLWTPVGKVAARYLSPWLNDRVHAKLGTATPFGDRPAPAEEHPADHRAALELALTLADDEADSGEPGRALDWLAAAEAIEGVLPPEYEAKRRRWTLGEPKAVHSLGESRS